MGFKRPNRAREPRAPTLKAVSASRPVVLSTSSVYPENVSSGFELASNLGFDGIELMVSVDPVSADIDAVAQLADYHGVPVLSVHAPCLLVTQRVWGTDPAAKLDRSVEAARRLGAGVVVVHPPFRWQGPYADGFVEQVRRLNEQSDDVRVSVENMYPWRTPGGELAAYFPGWDPSTGPYDHLTLDLSHASTALQQSFDLAATWGDRLRHLHLTDGQGSFSDEHLLPGDGDQRAGELLETLAKDDWTGLVVLEVNTSRCETRDDREAELARALAYTWKHLGAQTAIGS